MSLLACDGRGKCSCRQELAPPWTFKSRGSEEEAGGKETPRPQGWQGLGSWPEVSLGVGRGPPRKDGFEGAQTRAVGSEEGGQESRQGTSALPRAPLGAWS